MQSRTLRVRGQPKTAAANWAAIEMELIASLRSDKMLPIMTQQEKKKSHEGKSLFSAGLPCVDHY